MPIQCEWIAEEVFYISGGIILLFCIRVVFANVVNVHVVVHSIFVDYYII